MSETLDPRESGKKAAAAASPELLTAGHSDMKRRSKRAVSASSSLLREKLWLMLPEFLTKAPGTLVRSSLTLIGSSEESLQEAELQVTGFGPSPLTSLLDLLMTKPPALLFKGTEAFVLHLCRQACLYPDCENLDNSPISHSSSRK